MGYSYAETYRLEVKHYTLVHQDVPRAFAGLKIALITDVHRSFYFGQARVEELVTKVNALAPDLVVLGGDYIYADLDLESQCFQALGRLQAPLGVYAAPGNHDYDPEDSGTRSLESLRAAIARTPVVLLRNQGVWLKRGGARLRLGAVADLREDTPDCTPIVQGTRREDLVILVSHNPDYAEQLPPGAVDLVLAGHTHGGQLTFFGLWAPRVPSDYGQKYRTGKVEAPGTTVIVSHGVGTIFPPLRFFARPQVVLITLEPKS